MGLWFCRGVTTRALERQLSFALPYFVHRIMITVFNKGILVTTQVACIFLNNCLNLIDVDSDWIRPQIKTLMIGR